MSEDIKSHYCYQPRPISTNMKRKAIELIDKLLEQRVIRECELNEKLQLSVPCSFVLKNSGTHMLPCGTM